MTDLLKLIKAGDKVFSLIHGKTMKIGSIEPNTDFPIKIGLFSFNRRGSIIAEGKDCLIFPSEKEQNWLSYSPFLKGETVVAFNNEANRVIGIFSHMVEGKFYLYRYEESDGYGFEEFTSCEYIKLA